MTNSYYPLNSNVPQLTVGGLLFTASDYFTPLTSASITLVNNFSFINPAGTIAALTIVLPANPLNNQVCGFCSSQIVSALTLTGTVVGTAPTALAVGTAYKYRYNSTTSSWWPA
jgi:hypothetical protein